MHIETIAVHAGRKTDPATGAVAAPIYLTSTYERDADGKWPRGYTYSREENPTREMLEKALAALEGELRNNSFFNIFLFLSPGKKGDDRSTTSFFLATKPEGENRAADRIAEAA